MQIKKTFFTLLLSALVALAIAMPAAAAPGALNIYHHTTCDSTDYFAEFRGHVASEPGVASITTNEAASPLPSAATLAQYDGVIIDSYCPHSDDDATFWVDYGDLLGAYQRAGGVVVTFNWTAWNPFDSPGYTVLGDWGTNLAPFRMTQSDPWDDGVANVDPSNPLFAGITQLWSSGEAQKSQLSAGATSLATYDNGLIAVAVKGRALAANAVPYDYSYAVDAWARLTVNAVKVLGRQPVWAATAGAGTGSVTLSAGGASCGAPCSLTPPAGDPVTLSAKAGKGSAFTGWSGACSGSQPTCEFAVPYPGAGATATFASTKLKYGKLKKGNKLSLTLPGPGRLKVTGSGLTSTSKTVKKAGKLDLKLKAKRALKKKIAKRGKASVKLTFFFTPTGATSAARSTKNLTLK